MALATEFVKGRADKSPNVLFRDRVLTKAYQKGLLLLPCGKSSIRYIPSLIVTREQIDEGIEILDASLKAARTLG